MAKQANYPMHSTMEMMDQVDLTKDSQQGANNDRAFEARVQKW